MYDEETKRDDEHCGAHRRNTADISVIKTSQAEQKASTKTWRLVGSIAGAIFMLFIGFTSWVATDTLGGLRSDIKELKTSVNNSNVVDGRYSSDLQYLSQKIGAMEINIQRLESKIDGSNRRR